MSFQSALLIGCVLCISVIDRILKAYALSHIGEGVFVMTEKFVGIVSLNGTIGITAALFACVCVAVHAYVRIVARKNTVFHFLILAGAFSNVFDRVAYGAVIDWLAIGNFTVLNGADLLIMSGIIGVCVQEWRKI